MSDRLQAANADDTMKVFGVIDPASNGNVFSTIRSRTADSADRLAKFYSPSAQLTGEWSYA